MVSFYIRKSSSLSVSDSSISITSSSLSIPPIGSCFSSNSSSVDSGFTTAALDLWWNTNETAFVTSQAWLRTVSGRPLLFEQWNHWDKFEVQSESSGGSFTWMLFTQRLHLNLKNYLKTIKNKKCLMI